jgi:hypothetical protein
MEQSELSLLQSVPPYHLQALVKARHFPYSFKGQHVNQMPDPSSMTISEIARFLFEPAACSDALRGLAEMERSILYELVACGGRANSRDLALYFSRLNVSSDLTSELDKKSLSPGNFSGVLSKPPLQHHGVPFQYPTPHPHGLFEQAVHRLLLLGLLFWGKQTNFVGRDYASGVYDGVLIVPQTVMEAVKELWNTGEEKSIQTLNPGQDSGKSSDANGVYHVVEGLSQSTSDLQRDLYRYWSLVAAMREGMPLVNSRLLSRTALRQVVDQFSPVETSLIEQIHTEADVPHLLFIRLLLMKLGLLSERSGAIRASQADTFFSLPMLERARRCYLLWLDTTFWNELAYLPDVVVRPGPAPLEPAHEEVVNSRKQVMERILAEQVDIWHGFPAFIARTKLYAPYLLFPRQSSSRAERYTAGSNPYNWDLRLRRGWLTPREGWYLVEGGFIRAIVSGPLHWLGLVHIDSESHPDAFRLVPDSPFITSDIPPHIEEPSWGRLVVQPNFEVIALAPVSEALLLNLDRFAERIRLELVAQYRLTKASVTRAIQAGFDSGSIQHILEEAAGVPLPQNVQYSLVEWERQARRIELWSDVTLLEVDNAALLDTLFDDAGTRPLFGRRLSPLLAEVLNDHLPEVQEILWQQDYLPALISTSIHNGSLKNGRLTTHEAQWRLLHNGLLQPCHAVLDLFLVAEVERITELDEATGWRKITPAAIQQACNSGLQLDHIVRFLQQYCEGGVPASFLIRLKLWGDGYEQQNTIEVEQAPLLRLSNQVLKDIEADEELGPLLGAEVPSENRLVRIPPEDLERVIELLRERGFSVD